METHPDGQVAIPAQLNGKPVTMTIDTGSYISSVSYGTVAALGLALKPGNGLGTFVNGIRVFSYVQSDTFNLGAAYARDMSFFVVPTDFVDPGVSGLLGPDVMSNFDVELDFVGGKFNVFVPNTCPSSPVYWTREPYAEVPMEVDRRLKIIVPAQLDGRSLTVVVDTGATRSLMNFDAASDIFGWHKDDKTLKHFVTDINGKPADVYRYRFSTLTFRGIQVSYPNIDMAAGKNFDSHGRDDAQLILGMNVLRQLHLYVGYKAQKLYLTAAEAH
jgi:predicted aspartyl protease